MNSLTAIFLSLSLLASTTGLSVLKHYCGGELAATKVMATHHISEKPCQEHDHQSDCGHCEKQEKQGCRNNSNHNKNHSKKSHNCCDNEVQQFKVEDQFVFSANTFKVILNSIPLSPVLNLSLNLDHNLSLTHNLNHYCKLKIPDSLNPPELSVFIQSFLI